MAGEKNKQTKISEDKSGRPSNVFLTKSQKGNQKNQKKLEGGEHVPERKDLRH